MSNKCVLKYCEKHRRDINDAEISYHAFPKNIVRRAIWTDIVRRERNEEGWNPNRGSRICSLHFRDDEVLISSVGWCYLERTAIPHRMLKHKELGLVESSLLPQNVYKHITGPEVESESVPVTTCLNDGLLATDGIKMGKPPDPNADIASLCSGVSSGFLGAPHKVSSSNLRVEAVLSLPNPNSTPNTDDPESNVNPVNGDLLGYLVYINNPLGSGTPLTVPGSSVAEGDSQNESEVIDLNKDIFVDQVSNAPTHQAIYNQTTVIKTVSEHVSVNDNPVEKIQVAKRHKAGQGLENIFSSKCIKYTAYKATQTLVSAFQEHLIEDVYSHSIAVKTTIPNNKPTDIPLLLPRTKSVQINTMSKDTIWPYPVISDLKACNIDDPTKDKQSFFNEGLSYLCSSCTAGGALLSTDNTEIVPLSIEYKKNEDKLEKIFNLTHISIQGGVTVGNVNVTYMPVDNSTKKLSRNNIEEEIEIPLNENGNSTAEKDPLLIDNENIDTVATELKNCLESNKEKLVVTASCSYADVTIKDASAADIFNSSEIEEAPTDTRELIEKSFAEEIIENRRADLQWLSNNPEAGEKDTEIDKFKRRMIRAVARLRQTNTPDELWQEMKKETGCDCEVLWNRMRSLALKKIKRLLQGDDRIDACPRAARMSVTDWLLFDLVLVHEKIDVIGTDSNARPGRWEPKPLIELFSLVQRFQIEECTADDLVEAWYRATVHYNAGGHQVSPMLLQLRWHQLKEVTRKVFYDFWFTYRGNSRLFEAAITQNAPTALQTMIAKRFSSVVTKPFEEWEDKIKKGLVIVPEQFDEFVRRKNNISNENTPELEVIEPEIDTIDLDDESDIDKDNQHSDNIIETGVTKVKDEPNDVIVDESCQTSGSMVQKYLEAAEQNFDREACIDSDIEETDVTPVEDETFSSSFVGFVTESGTGDQPGADSIAEPNPTLLENPPVMHNEPLPQITSVYGNVSLSKENLTALGSLAAEISGLLTNTDDLNEDKPVHIKRESDCDVSKQLNLVDVDCQEINDNVGNILENARNVKLEIDNAAIQMLDIEENPIVSVLTGSQQKEIEAADTIDDIINKTCEEALVKLKIDMDKDDNTKRLSLLSELPKELNLVGDGIEIVDDGIAYVEEDMEESVNVDINNEVREPTPDSESAKIDLKLLLYPVVYTADLNQMGLADFDANETVKDKALLEAISVRSKPLSHKTVNLGNIKKEKEDCKYISDDEDYSEDISENRVKITSYLLQKPRTRSYNPIMLCKNPDFNTRLKRLNAGFFIIPRNISLLKECKPLTIDVSKAFESKLTDGKIFLKVDQHNIAPTLEHNAKDVDMHKVTVVPSSMPVQSLIDSQNSETACSTPDTTGLTPSVSHFSKTRLECSRDKSDSSLDRRRGVNLPDITEVRRINQQLLVAQVTPIQVQNNALKSNVEQPNLHRPNQNLEKLHDVMNNDTTEHLKTQSSNTGHEENNTEPVINVDDTSTPNTSNNSIQKSPVVKEVVDLETNDKSKSRAKTKKFKHTSRPLPWYSRNVGIRNDIPWLSKRALEKPSEVKTAAEDEALLTADALNKMLFLLSCEEGQKEVFLKIPPKNSKKRKRIVNDSVTKIQKPKAANQKNASASSLDQPPVHETTNRTINAVGPTEVNTTLTSTAEVSVNMVSTPEVTTNTDTTNDVQIVSNVDIGINEVKTKTCNPKINTSKKCCWASAKKDQLKNNRKRLHYRHQCSSFLCTCCCKEALLKYVETRPEKDRILRFLNPSYKNMHISEKDKSQHSEGGLSTNDHIVDLDVDDLPSHEPSMEAQPSQSPLPEEEVLENANTSVTPPDSIVTQKEKIPRIKIVVCPATSTAPLTRPVAPEILPETLKALEIPQLRVTADQIPKQVHNFVCKCEPKLHFNTIQSKIIVDGSTSCPVHKNVLSKFLVDEKKIYINKHQITSKPSDNPIYLGKNKILLTNIRFPHSLRGKAELNKETPTTKIVPIMPLPTGVQLVLLPDGNLTYSVDPDTELTEEQLQTLPTILDAVRKQLYASVPTSNTSTGDVSQDNDVVDLCEDIIQNKEDTNLPQTINDDTNNGPSTSPKTQNTQYSTELNTDTCTTENKNKTDKALGEETRDENLKQAVSTSDISDLEKSNKSTEIKELVANNKQTLENNLETNSDNIPQNESNDNVPTGHSVVQQVEVHDDKTKNILSDLMELSGITTDDTSQPQVDSTPVTGTDQPVTTESEVRTEYADEQPVIPFASNLNHCTELTPVTSFAELKYACSQNGSFYKLDYDSGVIIPINVCIKKKRHPQPTKMAMIDLTEDENPEPSTKSEINENRSLLIASQNDASGQSTSPVKPVKLFKTVPLVLKSNSNKCVPDAIDNISPSVLKKSLMVYGRPVRKTVLTVKPDLRYLSGVIKKNRTSSSKKKIHAIERVEATIDMVDSDCPMEEEYLENDSDDEGISRKRTRDSDDSSDDEPLSSIAKKNKLPDDNVEQKIVNIGVPPETTKSTDQSSDEVAKTSECDETNELKTCNVEILFDHGDSQSSDDCILGF